MTAESVTVPILRGIPTGSSENDHFLRRKLENLRLARRWHKYPLWRYAKPNDPFFGVPRLIGRPEGTNPMDFLRGFMAIADMNEEKLSNCRVRTLARNRIDKKSGRWFRKDPGESTLPRWVRKQEVRQVYALTSTLRSLTKHFKIRSEFAKNVLESYNLGFLERLAKDFRSGITISELAERHGVTEKKISSWLRSHGVAVTRGRRRPLRDQAAMAQAYAATGSINQVRREFGLSWSTTRKILLEEGVQL